MFRFYFQANQPNDTAVINMRRVETMKPIHSVENFVNYFMPELRRSTKPDCNETNGFIWELNVLMQRISYEAVKPKTTDGSLNT